MPKWAEKKIKKRGGVKKWRTIKKGGKILRCAVTKRKGKKGGKTVCYKITPKKKKTNSRKKKSCGHK